MANINHDGLLVTVASNGLLGPEDEEEMRQQCLEFYEVWSEELRGDRRGPGEWLQVLGHPDNLDRSTYPIYPAGVCSPPR